MGEMGMLQLSQLHPEECIADSSSMPLKHLMLHLLPVRVNHSMQLLHNPLFVLLRPAAHRPAQCTF